MSDVTKADILRIHDKLDQLTACLSELRQTVAVVVKSDELSGRPGEASACVIHSEAMKTIQQQLADLQRWRANTKGLVLGISISAGLVGSIVSTVVSPLLLQLLEVLAR